MEIYFGSTFLRTTHLESLGWDSFLDGMDTVQKIGGDDAFLSQLSCWTIGYQGFDP